MGPGASAGVDFFGAQVAEVDRVGAHRLQPAVVIMQRVVKRLVQLLLRTAGGVGGQAVVDLAQQHAHGIDAFVLDASVVFFADDGAGIGEAAQIGDRPRRRAGTVWGEGLARGIVCAHGREFNPRQTRDGSADCTLRNRNATSLSSGPLFPTREIGR